MAQPDNNNNEIFFVSMLHAYQYVSVSEYLSMYVSVHIHIYF